MRSASTFLIWAILGQGNFCQFSSVSGYFWGFLDIFWDFYHNSLSSTISFMLLMTLLLISLRSGWSSGISSVVNMALQALLNLEVSLTGLGNTVGLRVAKLEMPVISTIKFRKSKDQRKNCQNFCPLKLVNLKNKWTLL